MTTQTNAQTSAQTKVAFVNTPATAIAVANYEGHDIVCLTAPDAKPVIAIMGAVRDEVNHLEMLNDLAGKVGIMILGAALNGEGLAVLPEGHTITESVAIEPVMASDMGLEMGEPEPIDPDAESQGADDKPALGFSVAFIDKSATSVKVIKVEDKRYTVLSTGDSADAMFMFGGEIQAGVPASFILDVVQDPEFVLHLLMSEGAVSGALALDAPYTVEAEVELNKPMLAADFGIKGKPETAAQAQQTLH